MESLDFSILSERKVRSSISGCFNEESDSNLEIINPDLSGSVTEIDIKQSDLIDKVKL